MLATCIMNSLIHSHCLNMVIAGDYFFIGICNNIIGGPVLKYLIDELMRSISHQANLEEER